MDTNENTKQLIQKMRVKLLQDIKKDIEICIYFLAFFRYFGKETMKQLIIEKKFDWNEIRSAYEKRASDLDLFASHVSSTIKDIIVAFEFEIQPNTFKEIFELLSQADDGTIKNIAKTDLVAEKSTTLSGVDNVPSSLCRLAAKMIKIEPNDTIISVNSNYDNFLVEVRGLEFNVNYTSRVLLDENTIISKIRALILDANHEICTIGGTDINVNQKYDKVFINYPWGKRNFGGRGEPDLVANNLRFNWGIKPGTYDWYYLNLLASLLKENGKGIVLIPLAALIRANSQKCRTDLVKSKMIESVIKLPSVRRGTAVCEYAIVLSNNNDKIKFVDVSNEFIGSTRQNRMANVEGIIKIVNEKNKNHVIEKDLNEVIEKESSLIVEDYLNNNESKYKNTIPLSQITDLKRDNAVYRGYQILGPELGNVIDENGEYELLSLGDIEDGVISEKPKRIKNFNGRHDSFLLSDNDLVITSRGTQIKVAVIDNIKDRKLIPNGSLIAIKVDVSKINPYYLAAYLNSPGVQTYLKQMQTGLAILTINPSQLLQLNIPILDIETQNKIGEEYKNAQKEMMIAKENLEREKSILKNFFENEIEKKLQ